MKIILTSFINIVILLYLLCFFLQIPKIFSNKKIIIKFEEILDTLTNFSKSEFSENSKEDLKNYLRKNLPFYLKNSNYINNVSSSDFYTKGKDIEVLIYEIFFLETNSLKRLTSIIMTNIERNLDEWENKNISLWVELKNPSSLLSIPMKSFINSITERYQLNSNLKNVINGLGILASFIVAIKIFYEAIISLIQIF